MTEILQIGFPFTEYLSGAIGLFIAAFASIISVADPFGTMPVFTSLTAHETSAERAHIAKRASLYMAGLLVIFLLGGTYIISFFGISLAGIRVAGGFIIFRSAWAMLTPGQNRSMTDEDKKTAKSKDDVSFSPLAMPLLAGPGSIAVVMGLASHSNGTVDMVVIAVAILVSALVTYIVLRLGQFLSKYIGTSGMHVITRLMGFIVMAIAVQFILSGIKDFFML